MSTGTAQCHACGEVYDYGNDCRCTRSVSSSAITTPARLILKKHAAYMRVSAFVCGKCEHETDQQDCQIEYTPIVAPSDDHLNKLRANPIVEVDALGIANCHIETLEKERGALQKEVDALWSAFSDASGDWWHLVRYVEAYDLREARQQSQYDGSRKL